MGILLCQTSSLIQRKFVLRMWISAGFCVVFSLVAAAFFRLLHHPPSLLAWSVAILPALPILGALTATGAYLKEEKDEFQRDLLIQALLYGTGATLTVVTASAYLKDFAGVPELPLIWIYPMFWLVSGISYAVLYRGYK